MRGQQVRTDLCDGLDLGTAGAEQHDVGDAAKGADGGAVEAGQGRASHKPAAFRQRHLLAGDHQQVLNRRTWRRQGLGVARRGQARK